MYLYEKSRELDAIENLNANILSVLETRMYEVQTMLQSFIEASCAPSSHSIKRMGLNGSKVPP